MLLHLFFMFLDLPAQCLGYVRNRPLDAWVGVFCEKVWPGNSKANLYGVAISGLAIVTLDVDVGPLDAVVKGFQLRELVVNHLFGAVKKISGLMDGNLHIRLV